MFWKADHDKHRFRSDHSCTQEGEHVYFSYTQPITYIKLKERQRRRTEYSKLFRTKKEGGQKKGI